MNDEWIDCGTHHTGRSLLRFTLSAEPGTSGHLHDAVAGWGETEGRGAFDLVIITSTKKLHLIPQKTFEQSDNETTPDLTALDQIFKISQGLTQPFFFSSAKTVNLRLNWFERRSEEPFKVTGWWTHCRCYYIKLYWQLTWFVCTTKPRRPQGTEADAPVMHR